MTISERSNNKCVPTLAKVTTILNGLKFNPKKNPALAIVCETTDTEYIELRVLELITESRHCSLVNKRATYQKAIQLLTLALAKLEQ